MKPRWVSLEPQRERNRAPLSFCSAQTAKIDTAAVSEAMKDIVLPPENWPGWAKGLDGEALDKMVAVALQRANGAS